MECANLCLLRVFGIKREAWALAAISTIRFIETKDQVVFLTFDDGPEPIFTPLALAALKRYQSQATWFILGQQAEQNMEILTDI